MSGELFTERTLLYGNKNDLYAAWKYGDEGFAALPRDNDLRIEEMAGVGAGGG